MLKSIEFSRRTRHYFNGELLCDTNVGSSSRRTGQGKYLHFTNTPCYVKHRNVAQALCVLKLLCLIDTFSLSNF